MRAHPSPVSGIGVEPDHGSVLRQSTERLPEVLGAYRSPARPGPARPASAQPYCTVTVCDPLIDECDLSVALTHLLPTVFRVSLGLTVVGKVWTPLSAAVNV